MRPDARPGQAGRGRATRDVTFINVEPYELAVHRRAAPAGPRREQPAPGGARRTEWGLLTEPWIFVVDGDGIVRARSRLIVTRRGARRDPPVISRRLGVTAGAASRRVLEPDRRRGRRRPSRYQTRTARRRLVLDEVARRELGAVLERARCVNATCSPSAVRSVNAVTFESPRPRRRRARPSPASVGGPAGRRGRRRAGGAGERPRRGATATTTRDGDERPRRARGRGRARSRGRERPCPCSPARGPRARRRRSAGRSPARPRRSAGPAARARAAGRPGRSSARSASPGRRSGRRARAHSTISPPIASTAGSIASSEPPVVRMSSTSRTRSPGSIRKPRRNSRRRAVVGRGPPRRRSPGRRAGAPVSNARITPPVVGPGDEVDDVAPSPSSRRCGRPRTPHSSLVAAGSWRTGNFST